MLERILSLLRDRRPRLPVSRRATRRPLLEVLEERCCPAPLVWSVGVSLPGAATALSATLGSDQSILLFGNGSSSVQQLAPGAGSWNPAAAIGIPRDAPGVALVAGNPSVIVYGGYSVTDTAPTDATLGYDPTSAANGLTLSTMNVATQNFGSTSDGTFAYAIGGANETGGPLATVERYDASQDQWFNLAPLPQATSDLQAVYDGNGHIFAIGGRNATGVSGNVYEYSIANNTWSTVASLPTAEADAAAVMGAYGRLYVMGGIGTSSTYLATVQSYNVNTGTWATEVSLPTAVADEAAVFDSTGRIEVIGGSTPSGVTSAVYVSQQLNVKTPVFTSTPPTGATLLVGNTFTFTASATGVPQPTFSLVNPPANASIDPTSGLLAFTASLAQVGTQSFDVRASNSLGQADQIVSLTVKAPAPTGLAVTSETIASVSLSWTASTNSGPIAFYRVYSAPASTGVYTLAVNNVAGTAATVSSLAQGTVYNFEVSSVDTSGNESFLSAPLAVKTYSIPSVSFSATKLVSSATGVAAHVLTLRLYATGGNPTATTFSIVSGGSAYPGLTVNAVTGVVTWTPPDSLANTGRTAIVFGATNAGGTGTLQAYIFVTANVPVISATYTSASGVNAIVGKLFGMQLHDSSGTAVTWSLVSGPAGLTVSSTGVVSWTPTLAQANAANSIPFVIRGTNYAGSTDLKFIVPVGFAGAVNNVTTVANTVANTLTVNWVAPSDISSPVTGYTVTLSYSYYSYGSRSGRGGGSAPGWRTVTFTSTTSATSTSSAFLLSSLPKGFTYAVKVIALDGAGGISLPGYTSFTL